MEDASTWAMPVLIVAIILLVLLGAGAFIWYRKINKQRQEVSIQRGFDMTPMMIHLPPATDDIQGGGRDERDVTNEAISQAQIMYSILSSTIKKDWKAKILGQPHMSFEIIAAKGLIKYFVMVPTELKEVVRQAVVSAYPSARLEEIRDDNIFSKFGGLRGISGGELNLSKDYIYPIATYEETKWDAEAAILNALSGLKNDEGAAVQILFRPAGEKWSDKATAKTREMREGKKQRYGLSEIIRSPFEVPQEKKEEPKESLSNLQQEEIAAIEGKTKFPAFEVLIRLIASTGTKERSEAIIGGMTSAFSQFNSAANNGFNISMRLDPGKLALDYMYRNFPVEKRTNILNSVEMASIFHLPSQNTIPNSQVERQLTKQVDGPAKLAAEGLLLGVNEFRGEKKEIRLTEDDRRRHVYIIGQTGMGKSVLLGNLAYQDMLAGRGFAFIDPHGDVVEDLLSKVPEERMDDIIYFDPGDLEHPMGMNMFEYETPDQKDFIVQEGINMLYSLYDPGHTGIFGPRGEHMFRNAALLLMSDPNGVTFVDIPKCFIDPEFVKEKLKYVTDKNVYDYWTKEFPASQKSSDAGEVITWFVSKWGPFLSNTMMRNILGQKKSGFNIRELMDEGKILLVNLSKGKMGELNSKLLGMIFVMKFQTAAMNRVNIPEHERKDFCLFVDEFQNFSTDSFESILSEARKFRLNLVIANQFMTQLTDKIKDGILGNVGTIICGRIGITDAEVMEKAFQPTFNAEDLHKQPNYHAITTVMMFGMPSSPFTMSLLPPMGEENVELRESLKLYSATRYGRDRGEVEKEIESRTASPEKNDQSYDEFLKSL
ncbi:ATP-binding protein [Candidatus Saccharibacteria bacterium]|nr:ATP-binding protein [Candidatus Saccharibacteria bacterium]